MDGNDNVLLQEDVYPGCPFSNTLVPYLFAIE